MQELRERDRHALVDDVLRGSAMSESDWREMVNDEAMPAAFQQHAELPADDGCGCHEYWYGTLSEDACGCTCHDPPGFIRPDDRELSAAEIREFRARWEAAIQRPVRPEERR